MVVQAEKLISSPEMGKDLSYSPINVVDEFFNALVILDGATRENTTIREKNTGVWELKLELKGRSVHKTYHLVETKVPRSYNFNDVSLDANFDGKIYDVKIAYILTEETGKLTELDKEHKKAFSDNVYLPVDVGVHFSGRTTDIGNNRVDHPLLQIEIKDTLGIVEQEESNVKRDFNKVHLYARPEGSEFISEGKIDALKEKFIAQKAEKAKYEKEKRLKERAEKLQEERKIKEEVRAHRIERDSELDAYTKEIGEQKYQEQLKEMVEIEQKFVDQNNFELSNNHGADIPVETPSEKQARLKREFDEKEKLKKDEETRLAKIEAEKIAEQKRREREIEFEKAEKEKEAAKMRRNFNKIDIKSDELPDETIEHNRLEEERKQREMMEQESKRLKEQATKYTAMGQESKTGSYRQNASREKVASSRGAKMEDGNMKITAIDFIVNRDISWHEANIIKYVCRHKNGDGVVDIEKAIKSVDLLIERKSGSNFHHTKPEGTGVIETKDFIIKNQLPWLEGTIIKLIIESELSADVEKLHEVKDLLNTVIQYQYK